jgi:hypothetical protein
MLQLIRTSRTEGANQGVFEFNLYPPLLNLRLMNLTNLLSFDCQSTYSITSVAYASGILLITADYTEDM